MVIDLARVRAWRLLQDDVTRLAERIGQYRRILAPASAGYRHASDLLAIASELERVLRSGLRPDAEMRQRLLDVKIRTLLLGEGAAVDGAGQGLAAVLLDQAGRALTLFLQQFDDAAAA